MTQKLYSYILRHDAGSAPNPFWGTCTLTICKPDIRRVASVGDWVVGTGSKNSRLKDGKSYDFSDSVVYAMKVTKKLTLEEYDKYCREHLVNKIPTVSNHDYPLCVGDCIYDYSTVNPPILRKSVHNQGDVERDLSGGFSLLSEHFYYFGEEPRPLPQELRHIIKIGPKHKVINDQETIRKFEEWISKFTKNKLYSQPQLKFEFDKESSDNGISKCSSCSLED
ncbi:MAG TPA: hypothetical protein PKW37_09040 [Salinivirgaceae bacterium]|nr:hypothetical protein [Salinivirgaceae bacterium]